MDRLRIVEITNQPWELRWDVFCEQAKALLGYDVEVDVRKADEKNLQEQLEIALRGDAQFCRISNSLSQAASKYVPQTTQDVGFVGAVVGLIKQRNLWWPKSLFEEAFIRTLSKNIGELDLSAGALVVGAGGATRLVVSSLAKLGFLRINIAHQNETIGGGLVEELKKKFFDMEFRYVHFGEVTTLDGDHSIVVNTVPLTLENELLDELYFFNFLKADGVVVDLNMIPAETPLMLEAKDWGARHLSGEYFITAQDQYMLELLTGKSLNLEAYRAAFRAKIDSVPFDTSTILKRFRERGS